MGTCISKCSLSSPPHAPNNNNNNPQDKLVISQFPLPPSSSSSSASSSSSSTSLSTVSSCTSTSTCSSPPSSTTSKPRPYSNDFLLSRAKENPHIIVHAPKPKPQGTSPVLTRQQQRNVQCSVRLPAKRERSSSPQQQQQRSIARKKISRGSEMSKQPTAVLSKPTRTLSSPNNVLVKDKQRVRGVSENIRPPSPCNSLSRLSLKESPLVEDINNPLISMECFIFL